MHADLRCNRLAVSDEKKIITDPEQLRLIVEGKEPLVLPADDPNRPTIGWTISEVVPGSPAEARWNKELDTTRWTATDEADKYKSTSGVPCPPLDRYGMTSLPVLPFLVGRLWNNAALNVVRSLRPSEILVTKGVRTLDCVNWRVTVIVADDGRTIRSITQEVVVGLIGCRHGGDVSAYIEDRVPSPGLCIGVVNPRGVTKLTVTKDDQDE